MCGFFLVIEKSQESKNVVWKEELLESLKHRGPDEQKIIDINERISIGFCRLAIRDIEFGSQPYYFGNFVSAFNGEIYNSDSLKERILDVNPKIVLPDGDTQILAIYLQLFGNSSIRDVDGMFSGFTLNMETKLLTLFRDRVGEKPIFFMNNLDFLAVMSENRFEKLNSNLSINPNDIGNLLIFGFQNESKFLGSTRIEPGQYCEIDLLTYNEKFFNYWSWPVREAFKKNMDFNPSEFAKLLEKSVNSRLVSDVPISTMLSGGIDSSIITYLAQRNSPEKITAFTLGFENPTYDETEIASISAKSIGCDHEIIMWKNYELAEIVPIVLDSMDSPILDTACISFYAISSIISKDYKVALTGDGGDELVQGYKIFSEMNKMKHLLQYPFLSLNILRILKIFKNLSSNANEYQGFLFKLERLISVLSKDKIPWYVSSLSPISGTLLFDEIANSMKFEKRNFPFLNRSNLSLEMEFYYRSKILPNMYLEKADRMSMAVGLEVRSPLFNPELISYATRISQKQLNILEPKAILKDYAKDFLPLEVLNKKKQGFSPPFSQIMTHLEWPKWNSVEMGIDRKLLDFIWGQGVAGKENYALASWSLMVINKFVTKNACT